MADDPYEVLGVPEGAGDVSIKRAYRRKMFVLHPDTGTGDTESIQRIREACELLSDKEKRAKYDKVRKIFEDDKKEKEERDKRSTQIWNGTIPFNGGSGNYAFSSGSAYSSSVPPSSGSSWTVYTQPIYRIRTTLDFPVSIGDIVGYTQGSGFTPTAGALGSTPFKVVAIHTAYQTKVLGANYTQWSCDVELEEIP